MFNPEHTNFLSNVSLTASTGETSSPSSQQAMASTAQVFVRHVLGSSAVLSRKKITHLASLAEPEGL